MYPYIGVQIQNRGTSFVGVPLQICTPIFGLRGTKFVPLFFSRGTNFENRGTKFVPLFFGTPTRFVPLNF